jgi:phosphatidate cytidylyltransferase
MHLKRWLSGAIMAPGLILLILFGPTWLFLVFIFLLAAQGLREFYALVLPEISGGNRIVGILLGLLVPLSLYPARPFLFVIAMIFIVILVFILALRPSADFSFRVDRVSRYFLGLLYIPFLLAQFVLLRRMETGQLWVLFTLVSVYFGDTTAFYVGRAWGRRKLAPKISPGKTFEGGLGAVAGSLAGALLFKVFFFPQPAYIHAAVLGIGIGVLGQLGDLWESVLKRSVQAKDSGTLIPGHGGLLDRIDSVLFSGPFVYSYLWLAGQAGL